MQSWGGREAAGCSQRVQISSWTWESSSRRGSKRRLSQAGPVHAGLLQPRVSHQQNQRQQCPAEAGQTGGGASCGKRAGVLEAEGRCRGQQKWGSVSLGGRTQGPPVGPEKRSRTGSGQLSAAGPVLPDRGGSSQPPAAPVVGGHHRRPGVRLPRAASWDVCCR